MCVAFQVVGEAESAEELWSEAKEATMSSRTALSQRQTALAALQTAFWEKSRREGLALAKIKEVLHTPLQYVLYACFLLLVVGVSCLVECWRSEATTWFAPVLTAPPPPRPLVFPLRCTPYFRSSTTQ